MYTEIWNNLEKSRRGRYVSPQWNADEFAYALRRYVSPFPARAIMFHFFPIFFVKHNGAPGVLHLYAVMFHPISIKSKYQENGLILMQTKSAH